MARTVWKFTLNAPPGVEQAIELPIPATVLHVGKDPASHLVAMWVELNPDDQDRFPRYFTRYGTGRPVEPSTALWRGTAVVGCNVWHVYEREFCS